MASDETPSTAINAEMIQGKADNEKIVSVRSVKGELRLFANCSSSSTWTLLPNVQEPTVEELDISHLGLEKQSSLIFANSDLCNFQVCYFIYKNSKSNFFS